MNTVRCKFMLGQSVRLLDDPEKRPRMVTQAFVGMSGAVRYELSHGTTCSAHYEAEIEPVEVVGKTPGFTIHFTP